jgi:hypothetical protein
MSKYQHLIVSGLMVALGIYVVLTAWILQQRKAGRTVRNGRVVAYVGLALIVASVFAFAVFVMGFKLPGV